MPRRPRQNVPAIAGLTGIVATAAAADLWAIRTRRPTVSAWIAQQLDRDPHGAITVGVLAALGWHLLAHPIIRRLDP